MVWSAGAKNPQAGQVFLDGFKVDRWHEEDSQGAGFATHPREPFPNRTGLLGSSSTNRDWSYFFFVEAAASRILSLVEISMFIGCFPC